VRLVEEQARISAAQVVTVGGRLGTGAPFLLLNGREIEILRDCQGRAWWRCPRCGSRRRHLYLLELACRISLGLDYACRHGFTRRLRIISHIRRWRRMIGANQAPFSPIPRNPRGRRRYQGRVRLIRAAEQMLLGQVAEINDAAERRLARSQSAGSTAPAKRKRSTK
jgi:hypothetical protein